MCMQYSALLEFVGAKQCFDLLSLTQRFNEKRPVIRNQLSRWMRVGMIVGLRRGVYALPERYRRVQLSPEAVANQLYRPSYLSGLWALAHHDLISERVHRLTSITPRVPRHFENPIGVFDYRNIKRERFFGYLTIRIKDQDVQLAEPEKALLDHWHLAHGEWTSKRLREMCYQNFDRVSEDRLLAYAERFHSPRLLRAVARWLKLAKRAKSILGPDLLDFSFDEENA